MLGGREVARDRKVEALAVVPALAVLRSNLSARPFSTGCCLRPMLASPSVAAAPWRAACTLSLLPRTLLTKLIVGSGHLAAGAGEASPWMHRRRGSRDCS